MEEFKATFIISKVEPIKTGKGGTGIALYDEKGTRYSGFIDAILDAKVGDTVSLAGEIVGKYHNIKSGSITGRATTAPAEVNKPQPKPNDMSKEDWREKDRIERVSYEAQTAFKGIMDVASRNENAQTLLKFKETYEKALAWAVTRFDATMTPLKPGGQATPPERNQPGQPKPKTTSDEDFDRMGEEGEATAKKTATPPPQHKPRNPESILTVHELEMACHADFNMQPAQVLAYFNIKAFNELKRTPAEAYRDILATRPD